MLADKQESKAEDKHCVAALLHCSVSSIQSTRKHFVYSYSIMPTLIQPSSKRADFAVPSSLSVDWLHISMYLEMNNNPSHEHSVNLQTHNLVNTVAI